MWYSTHFLPMQVCCLPNTNKMSLIIGFAFQPDGNIQWTTDNTTFSETRRDNRRNLAAQKELAIDKDTVQILLSGTENQRVQFHDSSWSVQWNNCNLLLHGYNRYPPRYLNVLSQTHYCNLLLHGYNRYPARYLNVLSQTHHTLYTQVTLLNNNYGQLFNSKTAKRLKLKMSQVGKEAKTQDVSSRDVAESESKCCQIPSSFYKSEIRWLQRTVYVWFTCKFHFGPFGV